ncbi:nucleotidyltransferase family protein [Intestinibacter bartlettii]|uniref:nucleotidyltransferase domain-containing protein n=1 Tax=Intestinibacter bartlettii TaxID=261299 RepID=UPI001D022E23|nr:nucleotidyltransferase family protein [Intestinibacter bartlettii]MCB5746038.1 nucleotidyltransferase family protein [Intestinibacter bartlettii]MDU1253048.1 nucleotidyltransferase family protein [Peptostreptococcaceae bacterium]MDU2164418.1 nucleotidyltransferase family protein [Intestinibacter bartlettii]MDU6198559.1 nucleotidyltransferase family protein [Intestinibacter bartlettii]
MKKTNLEFLSLLKSSLKNEKYDGEKIDFEDLVYIYKMSEIHHVVPMIYNAAYNEDFFKECDANFQAMFKSSAFRYIFSQIQRTNHFLEVYKKLSEKNIKILVFKGIIFRNMYNNPDDRISSDEDILIKKEDYEKVKEFFLSEGFEFIDKGEECAYFSKSTGLCIEVSTSLFSHESKAYGHLNKLFEDVFEKSIKINIDKIDILTLSHEQHLIYIVFHNMKHFLTGGFGIRQVADFSKYIETYGEYINWEKFWLDLKDLNYDTFALNLIEISLKYLGFNDDKITYPDNITSFDELKNSQKYYINSESLINDILDAGVFGASTMDRKHTALMTLDAVEDKKKSNRLKAVFPNVNYLKDNYTYLQKYPILLPVAWGQRILSYLKKNKTSSYINTMELGKQRIELLKEYKIIK